MSTVDVVEIENGTGYSNQMILTKVLNGDVRRFGMCTLETVQKEIILVKWTQELQYIVSKRCTRTQELQYIVVRDVYEHMMCTKSKNM